MTLPSPIPSSGLNGQFDHSGLLDMSSTPSWHFPLILSLLLQYPQWFLSLLHLHPIILPSISLFLPTHYFLHVYDPKDHITWERTSQKLGGECTLSGYKIGMTTTTGSPAERTTQDSNFQ